MTVSPVVFDRPFLRQRRRRSSSAPQPEHPLAEEIRERLLERLDDVRRGLPTILELGSGRLAPALSLRPGTHSVVTADLTIAETAAGAGICVVADEELLPFGSERFDAVIASGGLHWVNDLPGMLAQVVYCLKPDGLFMAAMPGGETLGELRQTLLQAEVEMTGGASPRVSPFVDLRAGAALLQRAGLALPVADQDRITVRYAEPWRLIDELRAHGQANALVDRARAPVRRAVLARAMEIYRETFGDADGRVPATVDILFLAGWKPHASQPAALARGSGAVSLLKALTPPAAD